MSGCPQNAIRFERFQDVRGAVHGITQKVSEVRGWYNIGGDDRVKLQAKLDEPRSPESLRQDTAAFHVLVRD